MDYTTEFSRVTNYRLILTTYVILNISSICMYFTFKSSYLLYIHNIQH